MLPRQRFASVAVLVSLVVVTVWGAALGLGSLDAERTEANVVLPPATARPSDTTWVAMDPYQCEWTPWELEWWEDHGGDFSSYPRNPEDERAIITAFLERRGIPLTDFDVEVFAEVVPAVCGAGRGYRFLILVRDADVGAMIELGFRVVSR